MPDPWLNVGHEEKLTPPFSEPPGDDLEPCVTQQMVSMGFESDEIEIALTKKAYNNVMGTYLILHTKKPKVRCQTIRVKPFQSTNLNSLSPSSDQEAQVASSWFQQAGKPKDQDSGQKAEESAISSTSLQSRNPTPGLSPKEGGHAVTQPAVEDSHSQTQPGVKV